MRCPIKDALAQDEAKICRLRTRARPACGGRDRCSTSVSGGAACAIRIAAVVRSVVAERAHANGDVMIDAMAARQATQRLVTER